MSYDITGKFIQNKQYGLIKPQGKQGLNILSKNPFAEKKRTIPSSFFECEDPEEEEESDSNAIKRANKMFSTSIKSNGIISKEFDKLHSEALKEDANIFDYDASYDSFKQTSEDKIKGSFLNKDAPPTSRYISNLKKSAMVREKEKDRIYERKLLKERELEDKEFEGAEKFVTTAYKEKLAEQKKWEYEERLTEEIEKRHDVTKVGMQGFYSNLLTKNISAGASTDNAISAYTSGSVRQASILSYNTQESESKEPPPENVKKEESNDNQNIVVSEDIIPKENYEDISKKISTDHPDTKREEVISNNQIPTKDTTGTNSINSITISDPKEKVMSARERFLARKMANESNQANSASS